MARGFGREAFGAVDVLVNHASAAAWRGVRDASPESFDRALAVAARGGLLCSQAALEDMDDGGTIIFTGGTFFPPKKAAASLRSAAVNRSLPSVARGC